MSVIVCVCLFYGVEKVFQARQFLNVSEMFILALSVTSTGSVRELGALTFPYPLSQFSTALFDKYIRYHKAQFL